MEAWQPLMIIRRLAFSWDGSLYGRPARGSSPDKAGLVSHSPALRGLLEAAPSGFPSQASLRNVFLLADSKFQILGIDEKWRFKECNNAADLWRKMCADVYNLAKNIKDNSNFPQELQDLMSMIDLKATERCPGGGMATTGAAESAAPSDALPTPRTPPPDAASKSKANNDATPTPRMPPLQATSTQTLKELNALFGMDDLPDETDDLFDSLETICLSDGEVSDNEVILTMIMMIII